MKKRALSLLMAFVMTLSLLPAAAWATETPKKITTTTEFADMEQAGNYILMADITIEAPYGSQTKKFTGTFDGNGHTIKLEIENAADHYQGAFAYIGTGGVVKNLITAGSVTLAANKNYAGGIAGMCEGTILNCGNTANITGSKQVGGIAGQLGDKGEALIQNCYNTGDIKGTATRTTAAGGIAGKVGSKSSVQNSCNSGVVSAKTQNGSLVGYSGGKLSNSWWYQEANPNKAAGFISDANNVKNYEYTNADDAVKGLNKNRGENAEWEVKADVPVLTLVQKSDVSSTPEISLKQTDVTLYAEENLGTRYPQQATLTAQTSNLPDGAKIVWEINNEQAAVIISVEGTDKSILVKAAVGGAATVTATVCDAENNPIKVEEESGEKIVRATCKVTVIPHIATLHIDGTLAVGETLTARADLEGGSGVYTDIEGLEELPYQWRKATRDEYYAGTYQDIKGKTGATLKLTPDLEGCYISISLWYGGQNRTPNVTYGPVVSAEEGVLKKDASWLYGQMKPYTEKFANIEKNMQLTLPAQGPSGSAIYWVSSDTNIISADGVVVGLPEEEAVDVTLAATLTYQGQTETKEFVIHVRPATDEAKLAEVAEKLSRLGAFTPRYGKDENVIDMVKQKIENDRVGVTIKEVKRTSATTDASNIAEDGTITYFYTDPNTVPSQWFGTYSVTFALTLGSAERDVAVPVVLTWDEARVKDAMREEILSKVVLPETVEANFDLPKVVDSKKWTLIKWTSSDRAVTISTEKQGTADTLFEPYVGVVTRTPVDQTVTLTAAFHFQYAESETPITLYKTFEVTVKADPNAADRAAFYQSALDAAMASHLTDAVTGERLTGDNGVYAVRNDIHFPTTRDMQIDGKYAPVVIRSSDAETVAPTDVANAARVEVYRPLPGEAAREVELTIQILDRPSGEGRDYDAMPVLAEKTVTVSVQPLTQAEIDAEIALMERAKANYWDGIRNGNSDPEDVTADLHAFVEYTQAGEWIYRNAEMTGSGIVPVALDNWYDQQIWRLFRSSNADVVAHENLLITRQEESKAVTVTSYLSSEVFGKYAEKYPQNADFQKLYKQPVTLTLVVTGTQYDQGDTAAREEAAQRAHTNRSTLTVTFSLSGNGMGFTESGLRYAEGSTVYDVFSDLLAKHGYTCKRRGSYIAAITSDTGVTLEEFDEGKDSGWLYRVNGELVGQYMSSQSLKNGDRIEVYFTSDWTREPDAGGWSKPGKIETVTNPDGSITRTETKTDGTTVITTTRPDGGKVETTVSARGEVTASVSIPEASGSVRVEIPVNEPTNGMVAVIVCPDGTEELVRSSVVTETGVALRVSGDVRLRIIDNAKRFNDMEAHWAKNEVLFASSRELFNGVGSGAFGPNLPMTRGMVNTVLARLGDIDTNGGETWYARGTAWAVEHGVSDGTNPEGNVTREQLAAMLYRYAGSPAVAGELSFDDAQDVSAWARDAVKWCADNGILNGVGGNRCAPQAEAERAQVAAMLMRFLQKTV